MASAPTVTTSDSPNVILPSQGANTTDTASPVTDETTSERQASPSRKRRRSDKVVAPIPRSKPSPVSPSTTTVTKAVTPPPDQAPVILTGAAALAAEQRAKEEQEREAAGQTSPNPARKAIEGLFASQNAMSKAQDAPSTAPLSEPLAAVTSSIRVAASGQGDDNTVEPSPRSTASVGTSADQQTTMIITNGESAASPGQIGDGTGDEEDGPPRHKHLKSHSATFDEPRSNKALTFPGLLTGQPHRTASLPQPGYGQDDNRSPSTKRHKCPHCNTDFTRHHNLKSHLLTHSHEKPYSCDTCDSRFRRLHDLKRHTKLHTGERPHVCPKCDRSFARGDALARHTKGQGGCAGRRSSVGSFGGDDKHDGARSGDGDSMTGIMYTGEASHEPENMEDEMDTTSGPSLPSIRKHDAPPDHHSRRSTDYSSYTPRGPSTYPPVAARPPNTGGLYPPPSTSPRGGSAPGSGQSSLNQYPSGPGSSSFQTSGFNVIAQGSMTESPKPLSPGGVANHQLGQSAPGPHRNRSPSLSEQYQPNQYSRRNTAGHTSPPPMSLPPPPPTANHSSAPHLPPLSGLAPSEPRYLPNQNSVHGHIAGSNNISGPPMGSPSYPPANASSANNSLSSHSTGPQTSLDRTQTAYAQPNDRLWAYVQGLEAKVNRLEEEVASLRGQTVGQPQPR